MAADQIAKGYRAKSGGPPDPTMMFTLDELRQLLKEHAGQVGVLSWPVHLMLCMSSYFSTHRCWYFSNESYSIGVIMCLW
jgi:hypothetical protein